MDSIKVFAPATIGNIGPGFDVLGLAVTALGDTIEARRIPDGVRIAGITGLNGDIPIEADKNTAGIAAREVLRLIHAGGGVELRIHKNVASAAGLGSSAASAAGAAFAVNELYQGRLTPNDLILPATMAEAAVSGGFFADNTAPALLGGATLTRCHEPLDVVRLGSIRDLLIVVATPEFKLTTKKARAVLPEYIPLRSFVENMANSCLMVAAFTTGDISLLGRCVSDSVIEPVRAHLIPGFYDVKYAALDAGAHGCSISGAGPSVFAVTDNISKAHTIGEAMVRAFAGANVQSTSQIVKMESDGCRII
ncbi:MAG: homoserine kinase [Verrucomicrobia bacterium]|nr:homoserine kinase [Verrucomicrobiota bacterium]